jgi:bifunctional ADP-heptose synthase (sugar kinase/adenylyltransferase)
MSSMFIKKESTDTNLDLSAGTVRSDSVNVSVKNDSTDLYGVVDKTKDVRIWLDGAFDMMHYGHMNAFRQGRSLGSDIYVYLYMYVLIYVYV